MTTPSITFVSSTLNGNPYIPYEATTSIEGKTLRHFIMNPFEDSTTSPDNLIVSLSGNTNGGTPNSYMHPISHAGQVPPHSSETDIDTRLVDVVNNAIVTYIWDGTSNLQMTVKTDTGYEGLGARKTFSHSTNLPKPDDIWQPFFGTSGSSVMDVPTRYSSSFVVINEPDGNGNVHEYEIFTFHIGYNVDIKDFNINCLNRIEKENNNIFMYRNATNTGNIVVTFHVYHEFPERYEITDIADIVIQSGTLSFVEKQWNTITFDFGTPLSGTWHLKLYSKTDNSRVDLSRDMTIDLIYE